jgi:hypothetical protein
MGFTLLKVPASFRSSIIERFNFEYSSMKLLKHHIFLAHNKMDDIAEIEI